MLRCQHRMRPEISFLVRYFYEQPIEDHESVQNRDPIIGLKHNIYFIAHEKLEDRQNQDETSTTKINRYEAEYAVKLAEYLQKQRQFGAGGKITILTMYLGQMSEIRRMLQRLNIGDIRCITVDNYQGEENEIIILSLVRSNRENRIGFLNVFNRACVALSRARCGFYVIGNFDFICQAEKQDTWKEMVKRMKDRGKIRFLVIQSIKWYYKI
jgi:superfamily I DNA and/or RNA helicase